MNKLNKVLVSTTDTIEGLSVKQYIKPVSAHVVAGTNFFSDFFASFSDVFGGRSATYQRQLSSIYSEAIETLKDSALELGANCILGLKVDLDEISGKGKSMFMITATGTAVIIENPTSNIKIISDEKLSFISIDKMEAFRKRKEIIKLAVEKKFHKEDGYLVDNINEIFDFITKNSVYEIINEVIDNTLSSSNYSLILSYLYSLNTELTSKALFEKLMNENAVRINLLFDLFKDLRLYDADKIISYLQSENELFRHRALQLTVNDKQSFSKEDIAMYERVIQTIKSSYKEVVTYSTSKGLLSSKEKEVWLCPCGKKNSKENEYCSNEYCKKDKYGFSKDEINPLKAIAKLEENIEIIKINLL
jgi:uncharacterized protein YbjQ (UPF0145 family)/CDGSH-type Zn-finger protein